MKAEQLLETIKLTHPMQRTLCIEGPPGIGKTSIVHQAAQELGVPCVEIHMPTQLVEDFGIPYPSADDEVFGYKMPEWFPLDGKADDAGILLFDDRNQANADLQKVMANICQARTLHGNPMPAGWQVISTGNREKDNAGANRILSHLRNRETVLNLDVDIDDWVRWALDNNVPTVLISMLRYRPTLLNDFDPQRAQNPTPRSWVEGVGSLIGKLDPLIEFECFSGAVGEPAAAEFVGFLKIYRQLPNLDLLLMDPKNADIPSDPIVCYALSGALAARADSKNFQSIIDYTSRLPGEFSVLTVTMAARRDKNLSNSAAFTKWALDNKDLVF